MSASSYEATFAHLSNPSYKGGMESYYDFLRLFAAMLRNEEGVPGEERWPSSPTIQRSTQHD